MELGERVSPAEVGVGIQKARWQRTSSSQRPFFVGTFPKSLPGHVTLGSCGPEKALLLSCEVHAPGSREGEASEARGEERCGMGKTSPFIWGLLQVNLQGKTPVPVGGGHCLPQNEDGKHLRE